MSKKCKAFSISKLGLEPPDNRKAFYAGWDAALENMEKEWVGLTDEEIDYIWGITKPDYEDLFDFPRAIEAKLKEKNS